MHAKLRWESGAHRGFGEHQGSRPHCLAAIGADPYEGVGGDKGFWVVEQYEGDGPYTEVSGARTLRGVGHRHRMITILIHIHVRST